jgi:hypothetical protein
MRQPGKKINGNILIGRASYMIMSKREKAKQPKK